jgi:hypothetical protein
MESGQPVIQFDPYDWLPGHGENGIKIREDRSDLYIEISYDDLSRSGELRRELRFTRTCCFHRSSFPGPSLLRIKFQELGTLGKMVKYPNSEAAAAWRMHFKNTRAIDHYAMWFLSANLMVQAFSESYELGDETRVS